MATKKAAPKQGFWSKLFSALSIAAAEGPVVTQIFRPEDADLANKLGKVTTDILDKTQGPTK